SLNIEDGNTVANTLNGSGVVVTQDSVTVFPTDHGLRNSILGNSIFNNNGLGIELGSNVGQVHQNDPQDPDTGPNDLQNFPQVDAAEVGLVSSVASGVFNSTPFHHYRLEFFGSPAANTTGSPPGFGQGQSYLGFTEVDTDANGDASWSFF